MISAISTTTKYWLALYEYVHLGKSYSRGSYFKDDIHAHVQVYSLSLIFWLWSHPHYRSKDFKQDMIDKRRSQGKEVASFLSVQKTYRDSTMRAEREPEEPGAAPAFPFGIACSASLAARMVRLKSRLFDGSAASSALALLSPTALTATGPEREGRAARSSRKRPPPTRGTHRSPTAWASSRRRPRGPRP